MSLKDLLSSFLSRKNTANKTELLAMSQRNRLSEYLPWVSYDREKEHFLNLDNTIGYAWELMTPLVYQGMKQTDAIEAALQQQYPPGTNIQVIYFPDKNIQPILDEYKRKKVHAKNEVAQKAANETAEFFLKASKGLDRIQGTPVRHFRVFVFIKSENDISDMIQTITEMLASANLNPSRMDDTRLLSLLDKMINDGDGRIKPYTDRNQQDIVVTNRPLRSYAIKADTHFDFSGNISKIGNRFATCLTIRSLSDYINPLNANYMMGGISGMQDDSAQHNYDFFYCVNILFDRDTTELETKVNITLKQTALTSIMPSIRPRVEDFQQYRHASSRGTRFVKVIPTLWVFGESENAVESNAARAVKIFGTTAAGGIELQRESILNTSLYIASLPFGLYDVAGNINNIDRHMYMSTKATARFVPMQTDFSGNGSFTSLFIGRKGQIAGIDLFAKGSTSSNFFVSAATGAGKSVFLNTILSDNAAEGHKIRIIDVGGSYEKLCRINEGKYIRFTISAERLCINPLDFRVTKNEKGEYDMEDLQSNLKAAASVFAQMIYSKSGSAISETEWNLICLSCEWALKAGRLIEGTDAIDHYLRNVEKYCEEPDMIMDIIKPLALEMAFNLRNFTSKGQYGHFFCGASTIQITEDDFVVVELEELKSDPQLFSVVALQMMNEITQDLYLGDRKTKRFILFEEAPSLLKSNGNADLKRIGDMIEEGYRRARKYGGAFGVVMQSVLDTKQMGSIGDVILANSAYKFMLMGGNDYQKAVDQGIINYDPFILEKIRTLYNNKPNYSELFIETPQGSGIVRLTLDPFRYKVSTTEAADVARFYESLKQGKPLLEAIETSC